MLLRPQGVLGSGSRPDRSRPATVPDLAVPVRAGVRLAVDVGSVRIGVARSDPGGVLATPLTVLASGPGAKNELANLAAEADAIEVIVRLPTGLWGRGGGAAGWGREFR